MLSESLIYEESRISRISTIAKLKSEIKTLYEQIFSLYLGRDCVILDMKKGLSSKNGNEKVEKNYFETPHEDMIPWLEKYCFSYKKFITSDGNCFFVIKEKNHTVISENTEVIVEQDILKMYPEVDKMLMILTLLESRIFEIKKKSLTKETELLLSRSLSQTSNHNR